MNKNKVICIGEALIDRIRNKSNQGFTDFLGGAPANVAFALRKLKIDSIFIGSLGSDNFGKKFILQQSPEHCEQSPLWFSRIISMLLWSNR